MGFGGFVLGTNLFSTARIIKSLTKAPSMPLVVSFLPQACPDTAVALGGAVFDHVGNGLLDGGVISSFG